MSNSMEFAINRKLVKPASSTPMIKCDLFAILESTSPTHLIKTYLLQDYKRNKSMVSNFLKVNKAIDHQPHLILKVLDHHQTSSACVVLMEGYSKSFSQLVELKHFATFADLGKLLTQVSQGIHTLFSAGIEDFFLNNQTVVMDYSGNFRLTHFDLSLQESDHRDLQAKLYKDYPRAPEIVAKEELTKQSAIWDLGVLLYQAMFRTLPIVDYDVRVVKFPGDADDNVFLKILKKCLDFNPSSRPESNGLLALLAQELNEFTEFSIKLSDRNELANQAKRLLIFETLPLNSIYDNFSGENNYPSNLTKTAECIKVMLDDKTMIPDKILQTMISKAWRVPEKSIKFYTEIKRKIGKSPNSIVVALKTVIILHAYIHRGPKSSLITYLKEDTSANSVTDLLRLVRPTLANSKDFISISYHDFVSSKFQLHFKHIKAINGNFSIPNSNLYENWSRVLAPELLIDLVEHLHLTFTLLLNCKRYSFNYFVKNIVLFLVKEFYSSLALFFNLLTLLDYLVAKMAVKSEKILSFIKYSLFICENHRIGFNSYVKSLSRNNFRVIENFLIAPNLIESFLKLDQEFNSTSEDLDIKFFTQKYMNSVVRIPECLDQNSYSSIVAAKVAQESPESVVSALQKGLERLKLEDLFLLKVLSLPKSVKEEDSMLSIPNNGKEANPPSVLNMTMIRNDRGERSSIKPKSEKPKPHSEKPKIRIESSVQTDPIIHENNINSESDEEDHHMIDEEDGQNFKDEPDHLGNEKEVVNKEAQENEDFFKMNTVERFLMNQFARSVDEWILNFNEIQIDSLIATGSTCQVYKGTYKHIQVAIKKLIRPEDDQRIKFLKEFKREISVLISLPNQSNLLSLIGFCLHEHHVYLITEFCDGGTLFDILYRKSMGFQISVFADKKTKTENTDRCLSRDAISS